MSLRPPLVVYTLTGGFKMRRQASKSRKRVLGWVASTVALVATVPALAQQQVITGPKARYWVTAETTSGMSMSAMQGGGMSGMMAAMGSGQGPRKMLRLDLGAQRSANPAEGTHAIPPGLGMGSSLPLFGERTAAAPVENDRDIPEMDRERPRGRLLFFWGCGENAGPGQPVVLDFAQMANGVVPPNMRSITIRAGRSNPGFGRDAGYADWPNRRPGGNTAVPASASLLGEHSVTSNIGPDIRFSVGASHDYMDALTLQASRSSGGGQRLLWNSVATATGYFATAMGSSRAGGEGGDIVMWNASSQRLLGGEQLMGFLAPPEVERLIRERVVLAPATTECVISKEAVAAAGGDMVMVNLNAFGPELNVVQPPRPQDVRQPWNQEYAVKVRLRSSTGLIGGMEAAASRSGRGGQQPPADSGQGQGQAQGQQPASAPGSVLPGAAEAAGQIFRGLFGR